MIFLSLLSSQHEQIYLLWNEHLSDQAEERETMCTKKETVLSRDDEDFDDDDLVKIVVRDGQHLEQTQLGTSSNTNQTKH